MTATATDDRHRQAGRLRPGSVFRDAFRRHPTAIVGGVVLLLMIADRDLRAVARHRRSAGGVADPAA